MIQHFDLHDLTLQGEGIIVRAARESDEATLREWFSSEDARARSEIRRVDEFTIWPFMIEQGGVHAGFAQVWRTTIGTAGLEFFVAPEFSSRAVMTAAAALLASHLRDNLGWEKITVEPHSDDESAIASFQKAGFVDKGERRDDGDHMHIILEWP